MNAKPYPKYKASGVEWLGDVPEHWEVKRGRFSVRVNPPSEILRKLPAETEVSFVPMEAVGVDGGLKLDQEKPISEVGAGYTEFQEQDIVVAKITPCFENGKAAIAQGLTNQAAYGTTELHVLRSRKDMEHRFLFYVVLSDTFRKLGEAEMYGAGGQKRVPPEFCKDFRISLPPRPEQKAIADFLDDRTAKLDGFLEKKRALIGKLKEKRSALISRTVTKGLPPEAAAKAGLTPNPKLKPSGIPWLGDIPVDWTCTKVWIHRVSGNLELQDGNHGEIHPKAEDYRDDGIPFIMANHIVSGQIDFTRCNFIEEDQAESLRIGFSKAGDVLLTHKGTIGKVGIVQESKYPYVMLTPQVTYYRCKRALLNRFLRWQFESRFWFDQLKLVGGLGSTRAYIGLLHQKTLSLILPTSDEQLAISDYLDIEASKIDRMIQKVETAIEKLTEYRTSLITAAVTGKISVQNIRR